MTHMTRPHATVRRLCLVAIGLLLLAGCGSDDAADPAGQWSLVALDQEAPPDGVTVDLLLEDGQASGNSGCNQYTGEASWSDGDFGFTTTPAATMMACEEPAASLEQDYLAALVAATSYEVVDGELVLSDADGTELLRFE